MFNNLIRKIKKDTKRRGRGYGSGKGGHTIGVGQKGQQSRGKGKVRYFQEGGNTPISRRIPKYRGRGFTGTDSWVSINLKWLASKITTKGTVVDKKYLESLNVKIPDGKNIKIFGRAEIKVPFKVAKTITLSKGAKESLDQANKDK